MDEPTHIYSPAYTSIASNHSGFYHTPRIGDEVIISFLDNDIDKPFISGSLYNTTNPSLIHNPLDS
ncbi:MAG: phage baseplate assembly protein V, partial [Helicobacter sp.]|uniref:phage baseplate assembly protein V n=1 Tax=Helicobacter sp. TaxID=218 RepID=UPI002A90E948